MTEAFLNINKVVTIMCTEESELLVEVSKITHNINKLVSNLRQKLITNYTTVTLLNNGMCVCVCT